MHSQFKKFFVILSILPAILIHFLAIIIQSIRIIQLRISIDKLISFRLRQFYNLRSKRTRQTSTLTQNHIPGMVVYHCPALFPFYQLHKIHQCNILHILTERSHQRRITQLRPHIFHFVEKHYQQIVKTKFRFVLTP